MAKKTATKKKSAPAKSKPAKPAKAVKAAKTAKPAKQAAKATGKAPVKSEKVAKPSKEAPKPALMTKKGKAEEAKVETQEVEVKKSSTVVAMVETESSPAEPSKAEKISKIKPIKVDRGNLSDEKAKWQELYKKYGREKAVVYKMSDAYPSLIPLQHKVLGWGFVLTNDNDRLEVLFENGIRVLISNYKT